MGVQGIIQKFGQTPDMDAGDVNEDVWDGTGAYAFPAAATAMTVSSSNINDKAAGTGALTFTVIGLDANWLQVSQTVTMDGQDAVALPTSLIRVFRAFVATSGTGGINAGDIWVGSGAINVGVPANKFAGVLAGKGQTLMAVYSVPANATKGMVITHWYASIGAVQSAFASVALQVREFGGAWNTKQIASISEGGMLDQRLTWDGDRGTRLGGVAVGAKGDIRIRVASCGTNNSVISAGFDGELYS